MSPIKTEREGIMEMDNLVVADPSRNDSSDLHPGGVDFSINGRG
jgi:hypothetical protein